MSSILKALKKLEHEKSDRFPNPLNIDSDILRTTESSRSLSPFTLTLVLLLFFMCGGSVAYFFMKGTTAPKTTSQPAVTAQSNQTPILTPVIKAEALPAEIIVVPASQEPLSEKPRTQLQHPATVIVKDIAVKKTAKPALVDKPIAQDTAVKTELPAVATIPMLRVNGIAFQNSGADSVAIVNGTPISSGTIIEGVTVVDVQKDRVLFRYNKDTFEIQLGQSNR